MLQCCATPELLSGIVRELVGDDNISSRIDLNALFCKHRGNIRDALRELYDIYAQW